MDIRQLFTTIPKPVKGPIAIEWIMLAYCAFTLILAGCLWGDIEITPVINRVYILAATGALWGLYRCRPCQCFYLLRIFFQITRLSYWYPDIYHYARLMPNTDHIFAMVDQAIFGCQPSVLFCQVLSGFWWQELFNMGYFSYYIMIFAIVLWPLFKNDTSLEYYACVVVCSFILFYTFFLFVLSAGPQFYFQHIGIDKALQGVFPNVGDWFRYHPELVHNQSADGGLFSYLVDQMQKSEKPIAAFPSSHVGLSSIILTLAWKLSRKLFWSLTPFYVILCASTVYIGAHYAIDVLAGWIFALPIFFISNYIAKKLIKLAQ